MLGQRCGPWFKPYFSRTLLRTLNYLGDCVLLTGGGHDLAGVADRLRDGESVATIALQAVNALPDDAISHIPTILYFTPRRVRPLRERRAGRGRAASDRLASVSIIIPMRDKPELLQACLTSLARTRYPAARIEVIVLDNNSSTPAALELLADAERDGRIRVLRDRAAFNYSRLNNWAARVARGEVLVFLNNDTRVHRGDWLARLVEHAIQPGAGVIGAKLLYLDKTVQHGGVILGIKGLAGHAFTGAGATESIYHDTSNATREISAVTGACMAVRKSVFDQAGGFDERLAVAFNDVLLCLNVLSLGYKNVCIGAPLMIHAESQSRGLDDTPEKFALLLREGAYTREKHRALFKRDPYYNPNLGLSQAYELAWPPRTDKPWRRHARSAGDPARVLMLSSTHQVGHGVPVVLHQQDGRFVVLNVCRFHRGERVYKGLDTYAEIRREMRERRPDLYHQTVFVLCGKAVADDVAEMKALGFRVLPNLSDDELVDLYAAADAYANFSRWEGYNLGIGQALAMGLPVVASDIPAHREFPISCSDDVEDVVDILAGFHRSADRASGGDAPTEVRRPVVFDWDEPLEQFAGAVEALCRVAAPAAVRAKTPRRDHMSADPDGCEVEDAAIDTEANVLRFQFAADELRSRQRAECGTEPRDPIAADRQPPAQPVARGAAGERV